MSAVLTTSSLKSELGLLMRLKISGLYGLGILLFFVVLTLSSGIVTYQLYVNYFPDQAGSRIALGGGQNQDGRVLYFLQSDSTRQKLSALGLTEKNYLTRLDKLAVTYRQAGFEVRYLNESEILHLPPNAALFALDTLSLSDQSVNDIKTFVSAGGYLFFNYHFAFHSGEDYRANRVVKDITGLDYSKRVSHVKSNDLLYVTPKILSPLSQRVVPQGYKIGVELYDPLPVLVSDQITPDAVATNWAVTSPLVVRGDDGSETQLDHTEAGVLWHGRFGKGNWVYSSLPSYSLFSSPETPEKLKQLVTGIGDAATNVMTVVSYPYVDADQVVFVSEDTEYKFDSFQGFINAANRYRIPVTAFLVADLAEKHADMVQEAARSPFIELASHSYTHKKIVDTGAANIRKETVGSKQLIDEIAGQDIAGFRPPREEIDEQMNGILSDANFLYVLEKRKEYQYPTIESSTRPLYVIPRSATDDYQYLVNLDWDADEILQRMQQETELITSFNGIYSLSIHTHLMAYKKNIKIVERYFEYLNNNSQYTPMKGIDIIQRVSQHAGLSYEVTPTRKNFIIKVRNDNPDRVERLSFRAYWPQGKVLSKISSEILGTQIQYDHNHVQGYTDITLDKLQPQSTLSLIASYE